MKKRENWLVAVNGSNFAGSTVLKAAEHSKEQDIMPKITLLVTAADEKHRVDAKASAELAKLLMRESFGPSTRPDILIKIGEDADMILEAAEELHCDNIFMTDSVLKRLENRGDGNLMSLRKAFDNHKVVATTG